MRRPIVPDIKRTGRKEGMPSLRTGVVIDTRAGAGVCRIRLDNQSRRTIKNVIIPTGADLQSGDRVLLANLGQDPRWAIITRVQEGSDLGQHLATTNQGSTQLHPPDNLSVTGIDGAVKAEWDCWAGNSICWDVQHNDSASATGASTKYTRGAYFFYFSDTVVTRHIRVRAVRYDVEKNQAYYSAWSAWSSATSIASGFSASATPTANWLLALDSNAQFPDEVIPSIIDGVIVHRRNVREISVADFISSTDDIVLCDGTGGAFSVHLPASADSAGYHFTIKKIDSTANAITIDAHLAETIDGSLTDVLAAEHAVTRIVCDSDEWWKI